MTDNEIIQAFEKHIDEFDKNGISVDNNRIDKLALDLINRQKEEIERLEKKEIEIDDFCRRLCRMRMLNGDAIASYEDLQNYIQEAKSEAIKEFARKLKCGVPQETGVIRCADIDNFVKRNGR